MCRFNPVVQANFKAFGDIDYVRLAKSPSIEDFAKLAALLLLASSHGLIWNEVVKQIMGFPEEHQDNLHHVLKLTFSESSSADVAGDVQMLDNLAGLAEEFLELAGQQRELKAELAGSVSYGKAIQGALTEKELQLTLLRDRHVAVSEGFSTRERKISALKSKIASQQHEFEGIMIELKAELDSKDELLKVSQSKLADAQIMHEKLKDLKKLSKELDESRRQNEALNKALESWNCDIEKCTKLKGMLDFTTAQLASEKQTTTRFLEDKQKLADEIEELSQMVSVLTIENRGLYKAKYMHSRRVKHLSQQIDSLNALERPSLDETGPIEGENLHQFTIEQNKQMEEQLINYKKQLLELELNFQNQAKELNAHKNECSDLKRKLKMGALIPSPSPFNMRDQTLKKILENEQSHTKENIEGACGILEGTFKNRLRAKSHEEASLSSKLLKKEEESSQRIEKTRLEARVVNLLAERAKLSLTVEQLSMANRSLQQQADSFKADLETANGELENSRKAKLKDNTILEKEMKCVFQLLFEVESEVKCIRQRYTVA